MRLAGQTMTDRHHPLRADGRTGGRADGRTGGRADGRTCGRADGRILIECVPQGGSGASAAFRRHPCAWQHCIAARTGSDHRMCGGPHQ